MQFLEAAARSGSCRRRCAPVHAAIPAPHPPACPRRIQAALGGVLAAVVPKARIVPAVDPKDMNPGRKGGAGGAGGGGVCGGGMWLSARVWLGGAWLHVGPGGGGVARWQDGTEHCCANLHRDPRACAPPTLAADPACVQAYINDPLNTGG